MAGAVVAGAWLTSGSAATAGDWTPSHGTIAALEAGLVMPPDAAGPLATYARYYAGRVDGGHRIIVGELIRLTVAPASPDEVHIVRAARLPAIADGGCGVIRFTYDVIHRTNPTLRCGGDLTPP